MVIAIVILSVLLLLAIAYGVIFTRGAMKILSTDYIQEKLDDITQYYTNADNIEESFPCTLILNMQYNAKENSRIVDFSNYESSYIILYSILSKDAPPKAYAAELDESASMQMLIKNCYVNKYKDGEYFWEPM